MVAISTFVIFDIETTGLPKYERNRTKIIELTFLAVNSKDIESAAYGHVPLINKLSYLFKPQRKIQHEASSLTGLTDDILKNQPIFEKRIQSLISFLGELPKPVCLVAHNGNSFDFKILRSQFIEAKAVLPDDLLCVDSLWAFKKILKDTNLCHKSLVTKTSIGNTTKLDDDMMTSDEDWPELNTTPEDWYEIDKLVDKFSNISPLKNNNLKGSPTNSNENSVHVDKMEAIKNVFDKKPKAENNSYTLQALYKRLLNKEAVNAHRSEADCVMLLECIVALKEHFLPYANEKCKLISEVKPFVPY